MSDDLIVPPGAHRAQSRVDVVEPGYIINGSGSRLRKIGPSGGVVFDYGPYRPSTVSRLRSLPKPTRGPQRDEVLDSQLRNSVGKPSGATTQSGLFVPERVQGLQITDDILLEHRVPLFGDDDFGDPDLHVFSDWYDFDFQGQALPPLTSFTATWIVPPPPLTRSGQTLFICMGMHGDLSYHLVLQWGPSPAGGGDYWTVGSWYGSSQAGAIALHSLLTKVNPGDTLVASMMLTGQDGVSSSYTCQFLGIPESMLSIQNVPTLISAEMVVTAFGLTQPLDYPANGMTAMTAISLKSGGVDVAPVAPWVIPDSRIGASASGQWIDLVSNYSPGGEVDFHYSPAISAFQGRGADGRLEVFVRGNDTHLWHLYQTAPNGDWSSWEDLSVYRPLGVTIAGEPAVGSAADGRLEVFVRGSDGHLWHLYQTTANGDWSGWVDLNVYLSLGVTVVGEPAVRGAANRALEIFVLGSDGHLWRLNQSNPSAGDWHGWSDLGVPLGVAALSEPVVGSAADGRLEIFVLGSDSHLWHLYQTELNGAWSSWEDLSVYRPIGVAVAGTPAVGGPPPRSQRPTGIRYSNNRQRPI
jgi:hypothetical protein